MGESPVSAFYNSLLFHSGDKVLPKKGGRGKREGEEEKESTIELSSLYLLII